MRLPSLVVKKSTSTHEIPFGNNITKVTGSAKSQAWSPARVKNLLRRILVAGL